MKALYKPVHPLISWIVITFMSIVFVCTLLVVLKASGVDWEDPILDSFGQYKVVCGLLSDTSNWRQVMTPSGPKYVCTYAGE